MHKYLSPNAYLPHAAPMVLLEEVIELEVGKGTCAVKVCNEGVLAPYLNQVGELASWLGLEIMAQTVGVLGGWQAQQAADATPSDFTPAGGMLIAAKVYTATSPSFAANSRLISQVTLEQSLGNLNNYAASLFINQQEVAKAKLSIWQE